MKTQYPEETSITLDFAGGYSEKFDGSIADAMQTIERNASFATPIQWNDENFMGGVAGVNQCKYVRRVATQMGSDNQPRYVGAVIIKGVTPTR